MAFSKSLPVGNKDFKASSLVTSRSIQYKDIDLTLETKEGVTILDSVGLQVGQLSGDVYKKLDAAAVTQALKTLLMTNEFEKPFQPTFGANIQKVLFDNVSDYTDNDFAELIKAAIFRFEPRVIVSNIIVDLGPFGTNDFNINTVNITVVFSLANKEEQFTFNTTLNRLR